MRAALLVLLACGPASPRAPTQHIVLANCVRPPGTARVQGRIIEHDGTVPVDAKVVLVDRCSDREYATVFASRADGTFALDGLPAPAVYDLMFARLDYRAMTHRSNVEIRHGETVVFDARLPKPSAIDAEPVLDPRFKPLSPD